MKLHLTSIYTMCLLGLCGQNVAAQSNPQISDQTGQAFLGIFSTIPTQRDQDEGYRIRGQTLEVWYRKDLKKLNLSQRNRFLCDSVKWIISGRRTNSKGLSALFRQMGALKDVKMITYDVTTSVDLDRQGKYQQKRRKKTQLVVRIDRSRAAQLNEERVTQSLQRDRCEVIAMKLASDVWQNTQ